MSRPNKRSQNYLITCCWLILTRNVKYLWIAASKVITWKEFLKKVFKVMSWTKLFHLKVSSTMWGAAITRKIPPRWVAYFSLTFWRKILATHSSKNLLAKLLLSQAENEMIQSANGTAARQPCSRRSKAIFRMQAHVSKVWANLRQRKTWHLKNWRLVKKLLQYWATNCWRQSLSQLLLSLRRQSSVLWRCLSP